MKTRILLDVGDFERYVIGQYYGTPHEVRRTRATRAQIRRFAKAALQRAVGDLATDMSGRQGATARRLAAGIEIHRETLPPRAERQRTLF